MLFVPWMYMRFEDGRVSSSQIAVKARRFELELIEPLLEQDDRAGVFGSLARGRLKRLPSSVYWAGLGAWGIRRFVRIPAKPIADSELMAITIPRNADRRRSEATLSCPYHAGVIGIRQSFWVEAGEWGAGRGGGV